MRKFILMFALVALTVTVYGQSQRLVLVEEFSQASCGPCAAANPAFNALLTSNSTKVVPLKYQTSWPGYDPMNLQTATDVAARVSYYSVTGVPHAEMDGNAHDDHPSNFTQAWIDTEYGVASPFTINLTHHLSADYDSIFITAVITCSQAVTLTGPVVAQVVITENHINFCSAPGSNGETDFYWITRKMLPSASGTTLPTTWTLGQQQTLNFAVPLPSYIYDKNQIAVVAFVQDNSDKNVKQAAFSAPQPIANDATLACNALTGVPFMQCTNTFTPSVTIMNNGSATLTSAIINYRIDNNAPSTTNWTGSLATNATASVTLPTVTGTTGTHSFKVYVTSPNGATDYNVAKDTAQTVFTISPANVAVPLTEGFVSTTYPPSGFIINNHDNDAYTWSRSTTGVAPTATGSSTLQFYSITSGLWDELLLPPVATTSLSSFGLTFDVAYAQYTTTTYIDKLEAFVSTDCGATWTSVYNKSGATLSTAPATGSSFVPTSSQWRNEVVDLTSYVGQAKLFVKFKGTSGYGNNLYVDNINLSQSAGIENHANSANQVSVYPNPFTNQANFDITLAEQANVGINIFNTLGEQVYSNAAGAMNAGTNHIVFDGSMLPTGIYYANILIGNEVRTLKISLIR